MLGIALVRRGRHQQEMVRHLGQFGAEPVGVGRMILGASAHLVGFIDDDQIPARTEQAFAGVFDNRDPGDGRDDLIVFLPGVLAVVGPQRGPSDDLELLAELVGHFPLPLERQVGGRDDQHPLDQGRAP